MLFRSKITILEKIDIALLKIVGKLINIKTIKNINYLTSSYRNSFNLEYNLFDICKRKQNLGESIIMVGYPAIGNGRLIISNGIVSSIDEKKNEIITTGNLYPGNSGGIALNKNMEIIGITTGIYYEISNKLTFVIGRIILIDFIKDLRDFIKL